LSRALREKRPEYEQRHDKVILLHDNVRPHVAKVVKKYLIDKTGAKRKKARSKKQKTENIACRIIFVNI